MEDTMTICSKWRYNIGTAPFYSEEDRPTPRKSIIFEAREGHRTITLVGYYINWEGGYFRGGPYDNYDYEVRDVVRWCYIDLTLYNASENKMKVQATSIWDNKIG